MQFPYKFIENGSHLSGVIGKLGIRGVRYHHHPLHVKWSSIDSQALYYTEYRPQSFIQFAFTSIRFHVHIKPLVAFRSTSCPARNSKRGGDWDNHVVFIAIKVISWYRIFVSLRGFFSYTRLQFALLYYMYIYTYISRMTRCTGQKNTLILNKRGKKKKKPALSFVCVFKAGLLRVYLVRRKKKKKVQAVHVCPEFTLKHTQMVFPVKR